MRYDTEEMIRVEGAGEGRGGRRGRSGGDWSRPGIWAVPWRAILAEAIVGSKSKALNNLELLAQCPPGEEPPDMLLVAARTMAALGAGSMCRNMIPQASRVPTASSLGLAALLHPEGTAQAEKLLLERGPFRDRGDLACDLAARHLVEGRVRDASETVRLGLLISMDHMELGRWRRFLASSPRELVARAAPMQYQAEEPTPEMFIDPSTALKSREGGKHVRKTRLGIADIVQLIPCERTGWMSRERIRRKLLTGALDRPAPPGSALAFLQETGVSSFRFQRQEYYGSTEPGDEFVKMEIIAERLCNLVCETRKASATAGDLWSRARSMPPPTPVKAAYLLAELALVDESLVPATTLALRWLMRNSPRSRTGSASETDRAAFVELHRELLSASAPPRGTRAKPSMSMFCMMP